MNDRFIPPIPIDSIQYLTKREYFTAMAMQTEIGSLYIDSKYGTLERGAIEARAKACIQLADEIIKQLERT